MNRRMVRLESPFVSPQKIRIVDILLGFQPNTFFDQELMRRMSSAPTTDGTGVIYRCHSGSQRLQRCEKSVTEPQFAVVYRV